MLDYLSLVRSRRLYDDAGLHFAVADRTAVRLIQPILEADCMIVVTQLAW